MRGFIALTSAVIISAVLMLAVVASAAASYRVRFMQLDAEDHAAAEAAAASCAEIARLKLAADAGYPGDETISLGDGTCTILSVLAPGSSKIIQTQGKDDHAFSDLITTIDTTTLDVVAQHEVASFE